MKRRRPIIVACSLVAAALLATLLWGWPGLLRGRPDPATDPAAAATRLAEGFARGDAATLALLAPEDGTDRQLLTPEAAKTTYGASPRILVEETSQGETDHSYSVTIAGGRGSTRFILSLERLTGPSGGWTPQPLSLPRVRIDDQRASGVDDPILINGTALTLPAPGGPSTEVLVFPLSSSTATVEPDAAAPLTSIVEFPRFALSIDSTEATPRVLTLGTAPGKDFTAKSKDAILRFLESCAATGMKQASTCPLAPPARERGVSARRSVSYSRFILVDGPPKTLQEARRPRFSAAVVWEQRVGGGPWTSASGPTQGTAYGSLARRGDRLEFVPDAIGIPYNISARLSAENPRSPNRD